MILNIIALIFILGVTFLNSIYGLFSGLMNLFCAVFSMIVAFGFFEPVNDLVTKQLGLNTTYSLAICFVSLYAVTLIVTRSILDNVIRGNVRIPMYVDWVGGGICGFFIAQISVGMLVLGFLMLPFGGRVMMYSKYERGEIDSFTQRVEFSRTSVWLNPDGFTVGLFNAISGGSLRGGTTFTSVYPDFSEWVFWTGNTVQEESSTSPQRTNSGDGFEEGLRIDKWWEQPAPVEGRYRAEVPTRDNPEPAFVRQNYAPESGRRLLGARVILDNSSADQKGAPMHRFRPTMIRLVGDRRSEGGDGRPVHYPARLVGGADDSRLLRIADIDNNFAVAARGSTPIEVIFDVDDDFIPRFIEYRRFARAPLESGNKLDAPPRERSASATPPPQPAPPPASAAGGPGPEPQGSGRFRFVDAVVRAGDIDGLPFAIDAEKLRASTQVELAGDRFAEGRLFGDREAWAATIQSQGTIERFVSPEGYRIFQIQLRARQAQSLAGQVFNFVAATTNQYSALDKNAERYPLAGYGAIVKRGGREFFEVFYTGTATPAEKGFNGLLDFKEVKSAELRDDESIIILIFVVKKGATMIKIENQLGHGVGDFEYRMADQ